MTLEILNILSQAEAERIHSSTMQVLEEIGVKFTHLEALRLFREAGATMDEQKKRVKIPRSLTQEMVRKAPRSFVWHARNPKYSLEVGTNRRPFAIPGYGAISIVDLDGNHRQPTLKDAADLTRLVDALPNMDAGGGYICQPSDVPPEVVHAHLMYTMAKNTSKCIMGYTMTGVKYPGLVPLDSIRMASVLAGGEENLRKSPLIAGLINPRSPLEYDPRMTDGIIEYAKMGQPTVMSAFTMFGATAPVTLAGALVQLCAEVLGGIVLAQLVSPGAPVVFGSASAPLDQRSGNPMIGSPEAMLIQAGVAQMARYYGVPSRASCVVTDSKIPDAQAAYEVAAATTIAAMTGLHLNTWVGIIESYSTTSPAEVVLADEICGMVKRLHKGIEINDETIPFDVLKAGTEKGYFLGETHTRKYFVKEYWTPRLADRDGFKNWSSRGGLDASKKAVNEAKKILAEHQPEPLPADVDAELQKIMKEIDAKMK